MKKRGVMSVSLTEAEAVSVLQNHINTYREQMSESELNSYQMAINALKKQIPTPIIIENGFVKCTECGKYIRFPLIDKYNNCPECGQVIDWEVDK